MVGDVLGSQRVDVSQEAQEILEQLYGLDGTQKEPRQLNEDDPGTARAVGELCESRLVERQEGGVILTPSGFEEARSVVRRHRLAERLLTDVLDIRGSLVDEAACRFEHILHPSVEERICSLLGHPRVCPHGRPIPPGECCKLASGSVDRAVCSLVYMRPGERGHVAYLHSHNQDKLRKLMAMGVLPGASVELLRTYPSIVFRVGYTQYAVDHEIGESVYVRLSSDPQALRPRRRWRWRLGNQG